MNKNFFRNVLTIIKTVINENLENIVIKTKLEKQVSDKTYDTLIPTW